MVGMIRGIAFSQTEMNDKDRRKAAFQEAGRLFARDDREGWLEDQQMTICRMLEKAFEAGLLAARNNPEFTLHSKSSMRLTDSDIPALARKVIEVLRLVIAGRPHTLEDLLFHFHEPATADSSSPRVGGRWLSLKHKTFPGPFSDRVVRTLIELGLFSEVDDFADTGKECAGVSEWGYELIHTGFTNRQDQRSAGASLTYVEYEALWPVKTDRLSPSRAKTAR
ncbi:hypothetical protein AB4Z52_21315 [Rhizobium sp. 2YAF20]|uniref:hypothetical protein n=1 Tax=Rhizobium sp. 2YAF20 TaxID=3233027 RepID=UPI003F9B876C